MKGKGKIRYFSGNFIVIGIALSLALWFLEALIHTHVFKEAGFVEQVLPSDTNEFWMRLLVSSLIIGFSAYAQTITFNRRRAEDALREERDRARKYLDIAAVISVIIDRNQTVTLINKKGCEVLGHREYEIVGKNWFDNFIPERTREETRGGFLKLISGDFGNFEYHENPVLTRDSAEKIVAWRNAVLKDDKESITAVLSSGEDITERRTKDEALRERLDELERFRRATTAREFRIRELKDRLNELEGKVAGFHEKSF